MSQNLSSAAVVIGALRVNFHMQFNFFMRLSFFKIKFFKKIFQEHYPGADPGFMERGFNFIKEGGGGSLCQFYLIFLRYSMKTKSFGLTKAETKLFHFHRILKMGRGVLVNPLNPLWISYCYESVKQFGSRSGPCSRFKLLCQQMKIVRKKSHCLQGKHKSTNYITCRHHLIIY